MVVLTFTGFLTVLVKMHAHVTATIQWSFLPAGQINP